MPVSQVDDGCLFVCVHALHYDGHDFTECVSPECPLFSPRHKMIFRQHRCTELHITFPV